MFRSCCFFGITATSTIRVTIVPLSLVQVFREYLNSIFILENDWVWFGRGRSAPGGSVATLLTRLPVICRVCFAGFSFITDNVVCVLVKGAGCWVAQIRGRAQFVRESFSRSKLYWQTTGRDEQYLLIFTAIQLSYRTKWIYYCYYYYY
jgi:hypothetical protein